MRTEPRYPHPRDLTRRAIHASRWMLAPIYLGLILSFALLLIRFFAKLGLLFWNAPTETTNQVIVGILSLVELSLMASLVMMVVFSGYQNYIARLFTEDDPNQPDWMNHIDFSDIKLKLMGSIVAITAIQLLEIFLEIRKETPTDIAWAVGIHLTFVVSCVMLAVMDRLTLRKTLLSRGE
ncbi:TIGR00645 family protein [Acidisoma sp. C75]